MILMLVQFNFENFLSFREMQSLRMVKKDENGKEVRCNHALVYGANAAGKSNLIQAFIYAKNCVQIGKIDNYLDYPCFSKSSEPTYMEFVLDIKGNRYSYGFEFDYNNPYYQSEWLHQLKPEGEEVIFEWSYKGDLPCSSADDRNIVHVPEGFSFDSDSVIDSKLFLGDNCQVDSRIMDVYEWFRHSLAVKETNYRFDETVVSADYLDSLLKYLQYFDTGIIGIKLEPFDIETIKREDVLCRDILFKGVVKDSVILYRRSFSDVGRLIYVKVNGDSHEYYEMRFKHSKVQKELYTSIESESTGTVRIIQLITFLLERMDDVSDSILVIDEIECSIHPIVMEAYVKLFNLPEFKDIQLVLTTHEQALMNSGCAAIDDIWFIDKKNGCSRLYSLRSFGKDLKNIDKLYLDGRFSATPRFSDYYLGDDQDD